MNKLILLFSLIGISAVAGSFGNSTVPPGSGALTYLRDGVPTIASDDTITPTNSKPIPVKFAGALLGSVNQGLPNTIGNAWPVGLTDGVHSVAVSAAGGIGVTFTDPLAAGTNSIGSIINVSGTVSLPTGASTSALQGTTNTALGTINTTLGSPFQSGGSIGNATFGATQSGSWSGVGVTGTFWQATQPISAASLPLPTGASTSANQSTEITALGTLNTTLGSPLQTNTVIKTSAPISVTGSGTTGTVSTVITLT